MRQRLPVVERFWRSVDASGGPDACWPWRPSYARGGYGSILDDEGRPRPAHRLSWEMHHSRTAPPDLCVCHACDFPPCVNPAHLWLGTYKDNAQDMVAKGRPPVLRRLFNEWLKNETARRRYGDPIEWAVAHPEALADAKHHVEAFGTWRDHHSALTEPEVRDGVRYYGVWPGDAEGIPEVAGRCLWAVPCFGELLGLYHQCKRPPTRGAYCTQHFRMMERRL